MLAVAAEPPNLIRAMNPTGGPPKLVSNQIHLAVHQKLVTWDHQGALFPMLAREVPSQDAGTWLVRADGTMQTTYRLRTDVTWHDGTQLTAADFVFGWVVGRDPDVTFSPRPAARQITRVDTPDPFTLVYEWSRTYPFANALVDDDTGPLPAHLLEAAYQADKERFQQLSYFNREFVGVGPYQVAHWELGSHMVLAAYDRFYAGRPKIDTITLKFITNPPTVIANLLAGTIDGIIPTALEFEDAMVAKGEWERAGQRPVVVVYPKGWSVVDVQFRNPTPRGLGDVRVRRGLLHGIDRKALVDTLYEGQVPVSDSFISPDDARWDWVKDVVARYDYDPRRAQDLLAEAGWTRVADGGLLGAAGERITLPLWGGDRTQSPELAIVGDYWKNLGITVEHVVITPAQERDLQFNASMPGVGSTNVQLAFENTMARTDGNQCPTEQTRWAGTNRGCYQNPALDRVINSLRTTIAPAEQRQLYWEMVRIQSEELPLLPLAFRAYAAIFRDGVSGVKGDGRPYGGTTWNIAEWDVR